MNDNPLNPYVQAAIDRYWESIPTVWHQIKGNLRKIAAENFDISVEQFHILRNIHKGVRSVSELAEVKHISRSAISQAVDALVARELVTRRQDADDRRVIQLELTSAGEEMLHTIAQTNRRWMADKLNTLSAEELQAICLGLETLHHTFTESA